MIPADVMHAANRLTDDASKKPAEVAPIDSRLSASSWPELESGALNGLVGDVVSTLLPHTEADGVTLLTHTLAEFSCMVGRGPHVRLDGDRSPLSFWPVIVGDTSKARKGSGAKRIKRLYKSVDASWNRGKHSGSLSSGEGLVYAVRDPERKKGSDEIIDEGVEDKRLFLVQTEFGVMLKIMAREGSSLSGHLRDAWDGETLLPMTKGNRIQASHPHIVVGGHVTIAELTRNLNDTETANGFGNRFCWFLVRRSKVKPFADDPPAEALANLVERLRGALAFADGVAEVGMTADGREWWIEEYPSLSRGTPGLAGSLLDRAEAQVRRMAALYALLAGRRDVDVPDLYAALCLWKFSEASVKYIFGEKIGDRVADCILEAVRASDDGLTDSQISALFSRHESAERLAQAKAFLQSQGLIEPASRTTGGRPAAMWVATIQEKRESRA